MKSSVLKFEIKQMEAARQTAVIEVIALAVIALFVTILLPSLLLRYLYDPTTLTAEPKLLEMIPVISFALVAGYSVYVFIANIMRSRRIKTLSTDYVSLCEMEADGCGGCSHDWQDFSDLDEMVEEVIKESEKSPRKKASSKKRTTKSKK